MGEISTFLIRCCCPNLDEDIFFIFILVGGMIIFLIRDLLGREWSVCAENS